MKRVEITGQITTTPWGAERVHLMINGVEHFVHMIKRGCLRDELTTQEIREFQAAGIDVDAGTWDAALAMVRADGSPWFITNTVAFNGKPSIFQALEILLPNREDIVIVNRITNHDM